MELGANGQSTIITGPGARDRGPGPPEAGGRRTGRPGVREAGPAPRPGWIRGARYPAGGPGPWLHVLLRLVYLAPHDFPHEFGEFPRLLSADASRQNGI